MAQSVMETPRPALQRAFATGESWRRAGVQSSGTNGQTVINGAQSFDNLYLVNGMVVNENLRGQPDNAVIEEAIQETTLLVGGVSAEYGRFTGGVISTITKSGGNRDGCVRFVPVIFWRQNPRIRIQTVTAPSASGN